MTKADNTESFIKKSITRFGNFLDYSLVNYKKSQIKVILICPIHGQFDVTPNIHLNSKYPCKLCSHGLSTQLFIDKAKEYHKEHFKNFDYSKANYKNDREKIIIICIEHGEFSINPSYHFKSKFGGCGGCSKYHIPNTEEFIKKSIFIHEKYNRKYDYSQTIYINSSTKVKIICDEHGLFEQTPANHYKYGCIYCSGKFLKSNEDFIKECNIIHKNKYDYSQTQYEGMFIKVKIICYEHGVFEMLPTNHLHNERACPKCSNRISKNEIKWLDSLNIPNDKNHRNVYFNINNKKYYADGFIPETNTVYEFDGDYWHGNPEIYDQNIIHPEAKMTYGDLYIRTINKKESFILAGFNVVSIWESDFLNK